ncbi:alkaline phosphatase family protein [Paenarthrobacter sp. Z7-10]|uniref:phospholipase C n=1 Tax=Paenarthrobacter sp. Z7-10 TaxID=2787635 RepID=UPI0022A8FB8A|nr:alkaline phosphatase family protein [Paenarthrobacter sp. Z7-10]MCZ2404213.1 alkaline phosphatase family protein [Paenarthrobacter sp. Z7-10]
MKQLHRRRWETAAGAAALASALTAGMVGLGAPAAMAAQHHGPPTGHHGTTATPIKHVVVIFGENVSFDHYFATYPQAANIPGETQQGTGIPAAGFHPAKSTPKNIATLRQDNLLAPNNPNSVQPSRLSPSQAVTCDQDHNYTAEQNAYNGGAMDQFVKYTSRDACGANQYGRPGLTMDYYDGNTVTGIWNYAQNYAMSDAHFSTTFGPSTPGALNLVSGQTHGAAEFTATGQPVTPAQSDYAVRVPDANGVGTVINDPDPVHDDCSNNNHANSNNLLGMQGKNIGDLLNAKNVSWGWFQGGFAPTTAATASSAAICGSTHTNVAGGAVNDYSPHHEPFQYYASTANPHHLAPASTAEIGHSGQANHQYDMTSFDKVVNSDNMPAVSFLKAGSYQDGHAAYSDPIDEQKFITAQVNAIEKSKNWNSTAIVLAYDDSDGWYDHVAAAVKNASNSDDDAAWCLNAYNKGVPAANGYADRCGPGPRQPLVVISAFAKKNFVDHTQTDQSSILRFIEDNWHTGQIGDGSADADAGSIMAMFDFKHQRSDKVLLNEQTGAVASIISGKDDDGGGQGDNGNHDNNGQSDDGRGSHGGGSHHGEKADHRNSNRIS